MTSSDDLDDAIKNSIHHALDPYFWYDSRARILESESAGVERLLYKILGHDVIASYAFAIDPFHSFRRIPKVDGSRLRTRLSNSVFHGNTARSYSFKKEARTIGTTQIPFTAPVQWYPYNEDSAWTLQYQGGGSLPPQLSIPDFITDSTNRSRLKGSIGGPLELFKYSIQSPPFQRTVRTKVENTFDPGPKSKFQSQDQLRVDGSAGYMEVSDIRGILQREQNDALIAFQDNIYALLARVTPTSKMFGLSRSIGELKDIRHLGNYKTYVEATKRRLAQAKDIPDLFLTVEFGLLPLIADIKTLLHLPSLVSKRLNHLLLRSGKPTSYRSKFQLEPGFDNPPTFKFQHDGLAYNSKEGTTASRSREVRIAVNSTFEFPPVELPQLNRELSAKLYGADIDLKTIYDLMPWSWLVDWFTGFGDYLNVIEAINTDPSLVNYGFVTYKSSGSLLSQYTYKVDDVIDITSHAPDTHSVERFARGYQQTGIMKWDYQIRKSVADLGVSTISDQQNLSAFQGLILSALIGQRAH